MTTSPRKVRRRYRVFGVKSPDEMNWDIVTLFVIGYEEKDEAAEDKGQGGRLRRPVT